MFHISLLNSLNFFYCDIQIVFCFSFCEFDLAVFIHIVNVMFIALRLDIEMYKKNCLVSLNKVRLLWVSLKLNYLIGEEIYE